MLKRDANGKEDYATGIRVIHLENIIRLSPSELNGYLQSLALKDTRLAFAEDAGIYIKENILSITQDTRDAILPCLEQTKKEEYTGKVSVVKKKRMFKLFQKGE